jgi:hypothetical protein
MTDDKLLHNSVRYLKNLENEHQDYFKSLPKEEQESLLYYTGPGYTNINNYLRGLPVYPDSETSGSIENLIIGIKRHVRLINRALAGAPPLRYAIEVCRGLRLPGGVNYQKGDVINLFQDTFTSTSFDPQVSGRYAGDSCCFFLLYLTPGTKGLYLGRSSTAGEEFEYLLAPGHVFRIIETIAPGRLQGFPRLPINRAMCLNCGKQAKEVKVVGQHEQSSQGSQGSQRLQKSQKAQIVQEIQRKQKHEVSQQEMEQLISQINIDPFYLQNLSHSSLLRIKELTQNCPYNSVINPKTHRCVKVEGKTGKEVLAII